MCLKPLILLGYRAVTLLCEIIISLNVTCFFIVKGGGYYPGSKNEGGGGVCIYPTHTPNKLKGISYTPEYNKRPPKIHAKYQT